MDIMLKYRNFKGSACFDQDTGRHFGMVLDIIDGIVYESSSVEGLVANFEAAVDEYIDFQSCLENEAAGTVLARPAICITVRRNAEAA